MSYDPSDDYPDAGPVYDGFGAPITESTHQVEASGGTAQTLEQPGESWVRCTCGEEMDSQASAGGPERSIGEMFQAHLEDVDDSGDDSEDDPETTDPAPWLHESGTRHAHPRTAGPGVVHWMPRDDEGPDCGDSGAAA